MAGIVTIEEIMVKALGLGDITHTQKIVNQNFNLNKTYLLTEQSGDPDTEGTISQYAEN